MDNYRPWIKRKAAEGIQIIDAARTDGESPVLPELMERDKSYLVSVMADYGFLAAFNAAYWAGIAEGYHLRKEGEK